MSAEQNTKSGDPALPEESGQIVTPWEVQADDEKGIDYDKLRIRFGATAIEPELLERFEKVTGRKPHRFLRRGLFYTHRDLDLILTLHEKGKPFYLYTGRGASSGSLHMGHMVPFIFTKWLQDVFNVPLVIQLTDDEKFFWKNLDMREARRLAFENAKDIIACGFDIRKTFIFTDCNYMTYMYPNVCRIQKRFTLNRLVKTFGFDISADGELNSGKVAYPAVQAVPCLPDTFPHIFGRRKDIPCLIPCAIDQDPYFRLSRTISEVLGYKKPALVHSKFFPALQGPQTKMSSSDDKSAVFVTDSPKQVVKKVKSYAFSGGGETAEEHKANGGNCDIDVPYQWLRFFLDDDQELERIREEYTSGRMSTGEIKNILSEVLVDFVTRFQSRRARVNDKMVEAFMAIRKINP